MTRARTFLLLATLAAPLVLAGCESFDPTAIFDSDIFDTKKKLQGERRPVFPEGTPGVPQGVPSELVRGYQAPAQEETTQSVPQHAGAEPAEPKPEPKPKAKPKPKPKQVAKPAEPAAASTARPSAPQTQPPAAQQGQSAGAWPSSPQPSGGVAWPEPPPVR
jgi:outer membrane biosynthesis protein TonB